MLICSKRNSFRTIRCLAWNAHTHKYQKKTPAQVFSFELYEILQNSSFKEHEWTAHLKTLAIIIAFENIFQFFGSEAIENRILGNQFSPKNIYKYT